MKVFFPIKVINRYKYNFPSNRLSYLFPFKETKNNPAFLKILNNELERLVPLEVGKHCSSEKCKELGATLKKCYYADIELSISNITTYTEVCLIKILKSLEINKNFLTQLISDKMFFHAVHRTILSRLNSENSGPIYLLRCAFDSAWMALAKNMFADRGIKGK